jgi:hypothetical protein
MAMGQHPDRPLRQQRPFALAVLIASTVLALAGAACTVSSSPGADEADTPGGPVTEGGTEVSPAAAAEAIAQAPPADESPAATYPQRYLDAGLPQLDHAEVTQVQFQENARFIDISDFYGANTPDTVDRYVVTLRSTDDVETVFRMVKIGIDEAGHATQSSTGFPYTAALDAYHSDFRVGFAMATAGSAGGTQVNVTLEIIDP